MWPLIAECGVVAVSRVNNGVVVESSEDLGLEIIHQRPEIRGVRSPAGASRAQPPWAGLTGADRLLWFVRRPTAMILPTASERQALWDRKYGAAGSVSRGSASAGCDGVRRCIVSVS